MSAESPASTSCFTYQLSDDKDLQQGDVLAKTEAIKKILEKVHPYYQTNDTYTHFIVLTQSCDLVRRDNELPKSRYITLASVRPLDRVIKREIEKYQSEIAKKAMVCKDTVRERLAHFVEQLLNNNLPEFFYLHPEPQLGFPEASCAFLRLSVSIRASEHYAACLSSRILSLAQLFQAKLGWLVGNMYSRVATDDWVPGEVSKEQFDEMIENILEGYCDFIDAKKLKAAERQAPPELLGKTGAEIKEYIKNTKVPQKKEELLNAVEEVVRELGKIQSNDESTQLKLRLSVHPKFREYTK
jgi:hypothetical protein